MTKDLIALKSKELWTNKATKSKRYLELRRYLR